MVCADPGFQRDRLFGNKLERQSVFLRRFDPPLPRVIGRDGPINLCAGGEPRLDRPLGKSGGVFQCCDCGQAMNMLIPESGYGKEIHSKRSATNRVFQL